MGFAVPWLKSRQPGDYRRAARAPLPGDRTPQVPALLGTARPWRGTFPFTHLAREGRMTVTIGRRELLAALGGAVVACPLAARAAVGDTGDRLSPQRVARAIFTHDSCVPARSCRVRLCRWPERDDRLSLGRRAIQPSPRACRRTGGAPACDPRCRWR